ncbi:CAP domain-containing protein [Strongyloides ratti]|uniref:CAP domain-containing protein n=1 Tax=Strongyloides ratti TaxID=34506 RepID=A0A090LD83_STRRB|nr:CAP domain-containing protein [Strongyloides ratti]CEF66103.1 CAP domain-containing protein [Strongyloides ratti]
MENFYFIVLLIFNLIIPSLIAQHPFRFRRRHSYSNDDTDDGIKDNVVFSINKQDIKEKVINGKKIFFCRNQPFNSFQAAFKYAKTLNREATSHLQKKNEQNYYKDFTIESYLGHSVVCKKIWLRVWDGCDYYCFARKNFYQLKMRTLQQINIIREHHKVNVLYPQEKLYKLAQKEANKIAKKGIIRSSSLSSSYGVLSGIAFYLAGNTVVNKWYDESIFYNFKVGERLKNVEMFTQLVWKNTKYFGIGVTQNRTAIYIVCLLYPKGNIEGKYASNVFSMIKRVNTL